MPRTNNTKYLQRHQDLRTLWLQFPETFVVLSSTDQWRVHDYYQIQSAASDEQLLVERARLSREQPSLPQAAGKAYHQLSRCFNIASRYGHGDPKLFFEAIMSLTESERAELKHRTGLTVHGLVQPKIDIDLLTRAFINVAERRLNDMHDDLDQAA